MSFTRAYVAVASALHSSQFNRRAKGATFIEYMILAAFAVIIGGLLFALRGPIQDAIGGVTDRLRGIGD